MSCSWDVRPWSICIQSVHYYVFTAHPRGLWLASLSAVKDSHWLLQSKVHCIVNGLKFIFLKVHKVQLVWVWPLNEVFWVLPCSLPRQVKAQLCPICPITNIFRSLPWHTILELMCQLLMPKMLKKLSSWHDWRFRIIESYSGRLFFFICRY